MRPLLQQLGSQSPLTLDHADIVKRMQKDRIVLLLELASLSHRIIKRSPHHHDLQPLPTMVPHAIDLQFRSSGRHEDRTPNFQLLAAIGNPLRMIARTGSDHSSCLLLLAQVPEGSRSSSNFETTNSLQILPLEVDISLILGRQVGRTLERSVLHDFFVFTVGLVDASGRHQLALSFGLFLRLVPVGFFSLACPHMI